MATASEDILGQAESWRRAGKGVALATVVTTWGSSPRPVGSQLAVDEAGAMIGSVSGGCIEGAVVKEASLLKQYKALMLTEGVTLEFTDDGVDAIARIATETNGSIENIGARRLQTGLVRTYFNPQNTPFQPLQDTRAFTCP